MRLGELYQSKETIDGWIDDGRLQSWGEEKEGGGHQGDFQGHNCKAITINMEQLKLGEETMEGGEECNNIMQRGNKIIAY